MPNHRHDEPVTSNEPVGSDEAESFPLFDTLDAFDAFDARLFEETGNVEALLTSLHALENAMEEGDAQHPERSLFEQMALAYQQLSEATSDDPERAAPIILERLVPFLVREDLPDAAENGLSRARGYLREWIDLYPNTPRAHLLDLVVGHIQSILAERLHTGAPLVNLCWVVSALGQRTVQLVDLLWEASMRAETLQRDEERDTTLLALARLAPQGHQRRQTLERLHALVARRPNHLLIHALALLEEPSSLDPIFQGLQRQVEDASDPSFTDSFGLQTLATIAAAHPDRRTVQQAAWDAIQSLSARAPTRFASTLLLGNRVAPACDVASVVLDLLQMAQAYAGDGESALNQRRLLYQRGSECHRPRQLAGITSEGAHPLLPLLHADAARVSDHHGNYATTQSLLKEQVLTALLLCGDPIVLTPTFLDEAVLAEVNGFQRAQYLDALAIFRWDPLPPSIIALITHHIDLTRENVSTELGPRSSATLLARSAATRQAFDTLLRFGFTFEGMASRDSATALASVALRLARDGDPTVMPALMTAVGIPAARTSEDTVETAYGSPVAHVSEQTTYSPDQRLAALRALEVVVGEELLDPQTLSALIPGLLDIACDDAHGQSERVGALEVIGAVPAHYLPPSALDRLGELALRGDLVAGDAVFCLAQLGRLLDLPTVVERWLPLQPHSEGSAPPREGPDAPQAGVAVPSRWTWIDQPRTTDWPLRVVATAYVRAPTRLAPAMASLLRQPAALSLAPLTWALEGAHLTRFSSEDTIVAVPAEVREALQTYVLRTPDHPFSAHRGVFQLFGRLLPEELVRHGWQDQWEGWSADTRQALAEALEMALPSLAGAWSAECIRLLLRCAQEAHYPLRRIAYRGLARHFPDAFVLLCLGCATSPLVSLRRRAAECLTWSTVAVQALAALRTLQPPLERAPEQAQPVSPAPEAGAEPPGEAHDTSTEQQRQAGAALQRVERQLRLDADPLVRDATTFALTARSARGWADQYLQIILAVCAGEETVNEAILANWRYGHALIEVGDDEAIQALEQRLAPGHIASHAAQWLRAMKHDLQEAYKKRREEQWPKPWERWRGRLRYGRGMVARGDGERIFGFYFLITPEGAPDQGTITPALGRWGARRGVFQPLGSAQRAVARGEVAHLVVAPQLAPHASDAQEGQDRHEEIGVSVAPLASAGSWRFVERHQRPERRE